MRTTSTRVAGLLTAMALAASGCADATAEPDVVDIQITEHAIELPDELPSGWTTFRFDNQTDDVHFGLLDLLPEGRTAQDSVDEVVPVFQDAMDLIDEGDAEAGFAEFANLPEWFAEVVYTGGPGLVGPGETGETTVFLEPGTYAMECYVKTDGVFHTTNGMIAGFEVTDEETSEQDEPEADVTVTLSSNGSDSGEMAIDGEFESGSQTIAVHFEDQALHGNQLGHDLHVGRVPDGEELDEAALGTWMNWITGLDGEPPVEFLGGTHDMPAGSTAYVDVTLTSGTYVLVSEVDDPASKGLLHTFTIP